MLSPLSFLSRFVKPHNQRELDRIKKIVSKTRAKKAAQKLIEHDEILTEISRKYGVQKRFVSFFLNSLNII